MNVLDERKENREKRVEKWKLRVEERKIGN